MEALGIERGKYRINVNNRKVLDGLIEAIGVTGPSAADIRMTIFRALDKLDRLGVDGVMKLLGPGRKDESGDFTSGAGLSDEQITHLINATGWLTDASGAKGAGEGITIWNLEERMNGSQVGIEGLKELQEMTKLFEAAGYDSDRIKIEPAIVRGLEYYTGPVFECELLLETNDEKGNPVRFGSVGGGGRYDDLVSRFTGQKVPATGFSIGVSRLYSALKLAGKAQGNNLATDELAPVVVTVMDKDRQGDYWRMVQDLRKAGIRAEMYVGTGNMGKQMKYADKRQAPLVIIQGGDEKARGEIQIKDLRRGSQLASEVATREEYASQRLAQWSAPESQLVEEVKKALAG
jgi:histidyl-tRNA synthetase